MIFSTSCYSNYNISRACLDLEVAKQHGEERYLF